MYLLAAPQLRHDAANKYINKCCKKITVVTIYIFFSLTSWLDKGTENFETGLDF